MMSKTLCRISVAVAGLLCMAQAGVPEAQAIRDRGYEPVEGLFEDLDPSARSLRQLEPGLHQQGGQQGTYVYRQRGNDDSRLYYVTPGVVAEFDRSQYIQVEYRRRQYIFQQIPANTVFHLTLPRTQAEAQTQRRVDSPYRLELRVDGRAQRPEGREQDEADERPSPPPVDWAAYTRHRQAQQAGVLRALDRLSRQP